MAEQTTHQLIENKIKEYENRCFAFGYGQKGRVAGIMRALLSESEALRQENAELKRLISEQGQKGITGEAVVQLLHALPEDKRLSGKFVRDNGTPVSSKFFEYVDSEEDPKVKVLSLKKNITDDIAKGVKADEFLTDDELLTE